MHTANGVCGGHIASLSPKKLSKILKKLVIQASFVKFAFTYISFPLYLLYKYVLRHLPQLISSAFCTQVHIGKTIFTFFGNKDSQKRFLNLFLKKPKLVFAFRLNKSSGQQGHNTNIITLSLEYKLIYRPTRKSLHKNRKVMPVGRVRLADP